MHYYRLLGLWLFIPIYPIHIVTTVATYASIAQSIGGAHVSAESLIYAKDGHNYTPTLEDIKKIIKADIMVLNGVHYDASIRPYIQEKKTND